MDTEHATDESSVDVHLDRIRELFNSQTLTFEESQLLDIFRKVPIGKRQLALAMLREVREK